jgi:hypothetical protein
MNRISSFSITSISLWCSLLLVTTGCTPTNPRATTADVYRTFSRTIPAQKLTVPHVLNRIGGDVIIVTDLTNTGRIDADLVATEISGTLESARIAASRRITVANDGANIEARLVEGADKIAPRPQKESALLHVLVPLATNLPDINTRAGNIEVCGNVGNVTAVISTSGDIKLRGANGNATLTTENGSITADILPNHGIDARAAAGNIDIRADGALISAKTTQGGNIRFYGTLRPGEIHQFTTEAGNIHVAVPAYPGDYTTPQIVYRFQVTTSASPVEIEYPAVGAIGSPPPALPICGFIYSSGPWDYHVENTMTPQGRIEVSPVVTGAYFLTGTLATNYFRFDTNQTRVSFYTPITQSIHIYTAAQLNEFIAGKGTIAPECQAALSADLSKAIILKLATARGTVYIHHRLVRGN